MEVKMYYPCGKLACITYRDKDGNELSYIEWYKNDVKKIKWNNTKYKEWYPTGVQKIECGIINGKSHGLYTEWYRSGKKKSEVIYDNGLLRQDQTKMLL